jgi:hypothetical protein
LKSLRAPPNEITPLTPAPPAIVKDPVPIVVEATAEVKYNSEAPIADVDGIVKLLLIAIDIY